MITQMKILIIRFSSFGDIVQAMSVVDDLYLAYRNPQVYWLVRSDLAKIPAFDKRLNVLNFDRKSGFSGLLKLAKELREQNFDIVYDAHFSLRSRLLRFLIKPFPFFGPKWIVRGKERFKRFLLFKLRINKFPKPYKGMSSYRAPLKKIGINHGESKVVKWDIQPIEEFKNKIVLCPSAAWPMKRWPIDHWKKLVELLKGEEILILGGPEDLFCEEIKNVANVRVKNLAGKLSLLDSCRVVSGAKIVISADTGLIHVADTLGVKGISLMGPTAFGFCSNTNIKTLEVDLPCRPCTKDGRGNCSQDIYQKCMVEITPQGVFNEIQRQLS